MGFLPILLPFLEAVTGKRINPGGPKRPFQKTDEFGGRRPKKKVDKCAPKPDFPGRPPCVYSGVLRDMVGGSMMMEVRACDFPAFLFSAQSSSGRRSTVTLLLLSFLHHPLG